MKFKLQGSGAFSLPCLWENNEGETLKDTWRNAKVLHVRPPPSLLPSLNIALNLIKQHLLLLHWFYSFLHPSHWKHTSCYAFSPVTTNHGLSPCKTDWSASSSRHSNTYCSLWAVNSKTCHPFYNNGIFLTAGFKFRCHIIFVLPQLLRTLKCKDSNTT